MLYLIIQIALTLFFTALIGITMGWLLRGLGTRRQTDAIEARWRARFEQPKDREIDPTITMRGDPVEDATRQQEIANLQAQIKQRDEMLAALRKAKNTPANHHSDTEALALQLQEAMQRCDQLQGHLAGHQSDTNQLKARLDQVNQEQQLLIDRLRDRESEIGRMSQEKQHAINTIASLQKELRTLRGERLQAAALKPVSDKTSLSAPAPNKMTVSRPVSDKPPVSTPAPNKPVGTSASDQLSFSAPVSATKTDDRQQSLPMVDKPRATSISRYEPSWRLPAPKGAKDNLQAIFGIGPKLEMQLNNLGIYHFEQIGHFESNDILWVAHRLKSFPGRIVRDRWIAQAQTLANQKRD